MTTATLHIAGRIIWAAELKETKTGSPMRGVLVAVAEAEQGQGRLAGRIVPVGDVDA